MLPILLFAMLAADTSSADQLLRAGRLGEAAAAYRQILATEPDSLAALHGAGISLALLQQWQAALPFLDRAYRLKPRWGDNEIALAQALAETGRMQAATGLLQTLTQEEPSNINALRFLSELLYRQSFFQNALIQLDKLRALNWQDRQSQIFRAVSLAGVGQTAEAEKECKRLMDAQPDKLNADVVLTYVKLLYDDGRYALALPWAEKFAAQQPKSPLPPMWKARLLLHMGNLEQAAHEGELSIALAPDFPDAHSVLFEIYRKAGRADDAAAQAQWMRARAEKPK